MLCSSNVCRCRHLLQAVAANTEQQISQQHCQGHGASKPQRRQPVNIACNVNREISLKSIQRKLKFDSSWSLGHDHRKFVSNSHVLAHPVAGRQAGYRACGAVSSAQCRSRSQRQHAAGNRMFQTHVCLLEQAGHPVMVATDSSATA